MTSDNPRSIDNSYRPGGQSEAFAWLRAHPEFEFKPASMREFLGPGYLDIDLELNPSLPKNGGTIRPGVKACLIEIFGEEISHKRFSQAQRALFTGGIGIGKSTLAAVALPYMIHYVGCLKDPQAFYGLMKGSRIAFMLMSTSRPQAIEVLFSDVKGRLESSPWFENYYKPNTDDKNLRNKLKFPKDIWLLPGSSKETSFEGYNILGGVIDEADSHQVTDNKDYADVGYDTIENRISSRFTDVDYKDYRGLLIVIGQRKSANGFISRKEKVLKKDPHARVFVMTIWESRGWEYYRNSETGKIEFFYFDKLRKEIVPSDIARFVENPQIIKIPEVYRKEFENNPVKALKDHAGIPPEVEAPFIPNTLRIDECMDRWDEHHPDLALARQAGNPLVSPSTTDPVISDDLFATDSLKRAIHIDVAYSGDAARSDALGFAMGHVSHLVDLDGEVKPYIVFDLLMRIKAVPGGEIVLSDIRQFIYRLRDERGFRIALVTLDGIESLDSIQMLNKAKIKADKLSVDRTKMAYEDLREAIFERRIEFPEYYTYAEHNDTEQKLIAKIELSQLEDAGKKIDHPHGGSKDVADAMAGVTHVLMGSPSMRRGLRRLAADGSDDPFRAAPEDRGIEPKPITAEMLGAGVVIDGLTGAIESGRKAPSAHRMIEPPTAPAGWKSPERDPFGLSTRRG